MTPVEQSTPAEAGPSFVPLYRYRIICERTGETHALDVTAESIEKAQQLVESQGLKVSRPVISLGPAPATTIDHINLAHYLSAGNGQARKTEHRIRTAELLSNPITTIAVGVFFGGVLTTIAALALSSVLR